jgi:hypothetical protein
MSYADKEVKRMKNLKGWPFEPLGNVTPSGGGVPPSGTPG